MAGVLDKDISDEGARYINPPRSASGPPNKKQRIDQSKLRQDWVDGCSAALPRRDNLTTQTHQHSRPLRGGGRGRGRGSHNPRPWIKFGRGGSGGAVEAAGWVEGGGRAHNGSPLPRPPVVLVASVSHVPASYMPAFIVKSRTSTVIL
jgi:hypothetical protein